MQATENAGASSYFFSNIDSLRPSLKQAWEFTLEKVQIAALLLFGAGLFYASSGFFFMGAVLGLTAPTKVQEVIDRIHNIVNKLPMESLAIGFVAFSAGYPFFMALFALYYGAWGTLQLINRAERLNAVQQVD